jgi:cytochrome c5
MKKYLYIFVAAAAIVACTPKVSEAVEEEVVDVTPTELPEDVNAGIDIYNKDCTKCHDAKPIEAFTKEQWDGILPAMIGKAELDETKAAQVSAYVYYKLGNQ